MKTKNQGSRKVTSGKPVFSSVTKRKVYQDVVRQVENAIAAGRLKEGDRLPPERKLKSMFKISRGSLREALRVLEDKGLIEVHSGKEGGAFIGSLPSMKRNDKLDMLVRFNEVSLENLAEFRERIEGNIAEIAAKKAGKDDLRRLKSLMEQSESHIGGGSGHVIEFMKADHNVHLYLAEMTRNPIFVHLVRTMHGVHSYFDRFLSMDTDWMRLNHQDLKNIVEAVERRQPGRARGLSREHVRRFNQL